jgi:hypothetical protein
MSARKTGMTGIDSYEATMTSSSRLLDFPDGLSRHITLNNWQWQVFDRKHEELDEVYMPRLAYQHAFRFWFCATFNGAASGEGAGDRARFEHQLRRSLAAMIRVNMAACMDAGKRAND